MTLMQAKCVALNHDVANWSNINYKNRTKNRQMLFRQIIGAVAQLVSFQITVDEYS